MIIGAPGEIRTPDLLVRRESLDRVQVDNFPIKSAREASNISTGSIAVSACLLGIATLGIRREPTINYMPHSAPPAKAGDRRPGMADDYTDSPGSPYKRIATTCKAGPSVSPTCTGTTVARPSVCRMKW